MLAWWLMVAAGFLTGAAAYIPPYYGINSTYSLDLDLRTDNVTVFTGKAILHIKTNEQVLDRDQENFVLNAVNLVPTSIQIMYPNMRVVPVLPSNVKIDTAAETWTIPGVESLKNNSEYHLTIEYTGKMNSGGGLFRTQFNGKNYISCQLYPSHGRKVFPGLDNPGDVVYTTLTLNVGYSGSLPVVVTGLDLLETEKSSIVMKNKYRSPIPTSLNGLYFTVGSYIQKSKKYEVWVPSSLQYVSDTAEKAVKIPFIKDLYTASGLSPVVVVVPGLSVQSDRGLGLAALSTQLGAQYETYTNIGLKRQDTAIIEAVVKGVFGAVISPHTWDDTWIVESIPRYIAETLVNQMERWEEWSKMALPCSTISLTHSWSEKSTPVIPYFNNTAQVINYLHDPAVDKGAAIMAMVESILPNENKLKFFPAYVNDRKGQAVSTDDFFKQYSDMHHFNSSANFPNGKTLQELIQPWLTQTGYPTLILTRNNKDVVATEEQFSFPNTEKVSSTKSWAIPIKYTLVSNTEATNDGNGTQWFLPSPNSNVKLASNLDGNTTVIANGLVYRTLYDSDDLNIVIKILNSTHKKIPSHVRAALLNDGQAFAQAGKLRYQDLLGMMNYLVGERDLEPWMAATKTLKELWNLLYFKEPKIKDQFVTFAGDRLRQAFLELGFDLKDPSLIRGMLRSTVTQGLCDYGEDYVCRQDTKQIYNDYIKKGKESSIVATDLIPTIYCNGLRDLTDDAELKKIFWTNYKTSSSADIKRNIFSYLACASNNNTINSWLKYLLTEKTINNVPTEDIILGYEEVASRPENLNMAITFLVDNYSNLNPRLQEEDKAKLIKILGMKGSSDYHINELKKLAVSQKLVDVLKDAIQEIKLRKAFVDHHYYDIALALFGYMPVTPTDGPTEPPVTSSVTPTPSHPTDSTTKPSNGDVALTTSLTLMFASLFALLLC